MAKNNVIFETPLNEYMRICLRLEHLFIAADYYLQQHHADNAPLALQTILKISHVVNRPDLKSKITQALTQLATNLAQLEQFSHVDTDALRDILKELEQAIATLHATHGRIGESLRHNEFLNSVRLHMNEPGGVCNYANPVYKLWLNQSSADRLSELKAWYAEFALLNNICKLILKLVRDSTAPTKIVANNGFYQQTLNPSLPAQLLRIFIPNAQAIYPDVSIGKHRLSIHFFTPSFGGDGKSLPYNQAVHCELCCCRI